MSTYRLGLDQAHVVVLRVDEVVLVQDVVFACCGAQSAFGNTGWLKRALTGRANHPDGALRL